MEQAGILPDADEWKEWEMELTKSRGECDCVLQHHNPIGMLVTNLKLTMEVGQSREWILQKKRKT